MNWKLRDAHTSPPGGWVYYVDQTKATLKGSSLHQLAIMLVKHYKANELILVDPFQMIMDQLCEGKARAVCYDEDDARSRPGRAANRSANWGDLWAGGKNLSLWFSKGKTFVDQETANLRAAQCAVCPKNQSSKTCFTCSVMKAAIESSTIAVKSKSTPFDEKLQACQVCKCSTKVLAHTYDPSYMNETITPEQRSQYQEVGCWKLK
jgi:hypothetical protein